MFDEIIKNILEDDTMLYFILGSMISAENDFTEENIQTSLEFFDSLEKGVNESDKPQKEKDNIIKYINNGREILNNELNCLNK